jgi:hypothetical protein
MLLDLVWLGAIAYHLQIPVSRSNRRTRWQDLSVLAGLYMLRTSTDYMSSTEVQ